MTDKTRYTVPATSEHVPLINKLAFGAGDAGPAITTAIMSFFLLFFFTDVAGLRPTLAGLVLMISTLWDAFTDPVVGALSDRTRSRLGRRRPWMLWGAVPFGITFALLWFVPPFGELGRFWYYLLLAMAFKTCFTVVNIPYTTLTAEMTSDYDERTSMNSFRFGFSIIGGLIAAVAHPLIVGAFADQKTGYIVSVSIWGLVATLPFFFSVWGTYERHSEQSEQLPFWAGMRQTLRNRPFLYVAGIYLFSWLAVQLVSTILFYYVTYWLRADDPNGMISLIILAVQGSALVWLFIWARVSTRIGKKGVYFRGMIFWILVLFGLFIVQASTPTWLVIGLGALAGVGVATAYLVPWSMLPDVIELDELETGKRREGSFYSLMVLLQKGGAAIVSFLVGFILDVAGYVQTPAGAEARSVVQPASAVSAIRWMIGPVPALFLIGGMLLVYFFPITREQHAQTLAALEARKAAQQEGA